VAFALTQVKRNLGRRAIAHKSFPQKNARHEIAQEQRKKALRNIFLAHVQILAKYFDLVLLYPAGVLMREVSMYWRGHCISTPLYNNFIFMEHGTEIKPGKNSHTSLE
jgi:hypothetical protein